MRYSPQGITRTQEGKFGIGTNRAMLNLKGPMTTDRALALHLPGLDGYTQVTEP